MHPAPPTLACVEPAAKPRRTWKQRLRSCLIGLVVVYVVWCAVVYSVQTSLLFPRSAIGPRPALVLPADGGVELIGVPSPQGAVETLVMHPTKGDPKSAGGGPVVLMFHGNAELARDSINDRVVTDLRSRGITVVCPEYRGYGTMSGTPGQKAIAVDVIAVADWTAQQPWCDKQHVVYFGWSLGGGVACQLATERKPSAGMILQSTFTSVVSFAKGFGVPWFLVKHPYRNDQVLRTLDVPVLIIHGTQDSIVPVSHGRALSKIARQSVYVELGGDHFQDWTDWAAYFKVVRGWLNERGM